ncbi:ATP-binding cassette domain-containing protein [Streptomyces sp. NPDC003077]|uniref:ABC transporter ATP-binding protein n=1 Tax=Streptomyces sp. NPDC003077 TaxID=3154443 RepID=UPI0033AB2218
MAGHEPLAIHARGLAKSYPGHHAVRGIDLSVRPGEVFGFLGPNGAGKSTTIALLCALARPTAGHARVAGADVATQPRDVRLRVGLLLQHTAAEPHLTLAQNLYVHARMHQLSRARARARTAEVLALAGLTERRRDKVRTLSGGLRRRLEIARALLHQPRVLFLDEPTTGLDPHARARVWDHLVHLSARTGTTCFVSTHHLEEAERCDRLAIMDHGRVVACGTPDGLKAAVGHDRLHLRTADDRAASAAAREDLRLDPVAGPDGGLAFRVPADPATVPRLCAALTARGIGVHALTVTRPGLDDVFFHHTGRSIRAGQPETEP